MDCYSIFCLVHSSHFDNLEMDGQTFKFHCFLNVCNQAFEFLTTCNALLNITMH